MIYIVSIKNKEVCVNAESEKEVEKLFPDGIIERTIDFTYNSGRIEEDVFRAVDHSYFLEDAKMRLEYWFSVNDDESYLKSFVTNDDYENMVEAFCHYQDCDIDDNSTWYGIISDHMEMIKCGIFSVADSFITAYAYKHPLDNVEGDDAKEEIVKIFCKNYREKESKKDISCENELWKKSIEEFLEISSREDT